MMPERAPCAGGRWDVVECSGINLQVKGSEDYFVKHISVLFCFVYFSACLLLWCQQCLLPQTVCLVVFWIKSVPVFSPREQQRHLSPAPSSCEPPTGKKWKGKFLISKASTVLSEFFTNTSNQYPRCFPEFRRIKYLSVQLRTIIFLCWTGRTNINIHICWVVTISAKRWTVIEYF